ncbi:hypothetical protein TcBrA4_0121160 [Trypanosoma cruzi]|nr:hypothetical protein TcBrA4_0121160 [Trypanosoma cruzi]
MQRRAAAAPPPPLEWSACPPGQHSLCVGVRGTADDRTLVALCADLRAFGGQCQLPCPLWPHVVPEHWPEDQRRRERCRSVLHRLHTGQSDEDTATIVWEVEATVNPTLCVCSAMRLIDTSILFCTSPSLQGRPCHAAIGCGWAQELVRPSTPCDPFSLDASTVRCTTAVRRPHRVGPTHLHSLEVRHGDSCTASLVPRVSAKDTSVHLAVNPAPLRRIVGFRAPTQHERLTRLRYIDDVRGAVCSETALRQYWEGSDGHSAAGRCRPQGTATRPQPHGDLPGPHPRPSC